MKSKLQPSLASLAIVLAYQPDSAPQALCDEILSLAPRLIEKVPSDPGRMSAVRFERRRQNILDLLTSIVMDIGLEKLEQSPIPSLLQAGVSGTPLRLQLDALPSAHDDLTAEMIQQLQANKVELKNRRSFEYDLLQGTQYFAYNSQIQKVYVLHPMFRFLMTRK